MTTRVQTVKQSTVGGGGARRWNSLLLSHQSAQSCTASAQTQGGYIGGHMAIGRHYKCPFFAKDDSYDGQFLSTKREGSVIYFLRWGGGGTMPRGLNDWSRAHYG